jgi:hypothetical protein
MLPERPGEYPIPTWIHSISLTFTLAIPSEVPSTQLISDPSNPYPGHHFSMIILTIGKWSSRALTHRASLIVFFQRKIIVALYSFEQSDERKNAMDSQEKL